MEQHDSQAGIPGAQGNRNRVIAGATLIALGLGLLGVPNQFEGPSLLHLSQGHGVSVSDLVALLPLVIGTALLGASAWRQRAALSVQAKSLLRSGGAELFFAGVLAGLVIARALLLFRWERLLNWAIIACPLLIAILFVRRRG